MSALDKLKEEEAQAQAALKQAEARHAELSKTVEGMRREMDELRARFRRAGSQIEAERIDTQMYTLSRRMAPVESQLSEAEKVVKGARNSLETVQRRLLQTQSSGKGKWVTEYKREET